MADQYTRLTSVRLRNFRCFREEQYVEFPSTGLYLVRGENQDTNGASGAGKTSFVKAISYAGGYETQAASKLKCWTATGPIAVEIGLSNQHGNAVMKRGTKPVFSLSGKAADGGADAQEFAFAHYLGGLSSDVLAAVTYRAQKKPGLFLSRPSSERKSFLATLLGLVAIEESATAATKRAGELHGQAQGIEQNLKMNEATLAQESQARYQVTDTAVAEVEAAKIETAVKRMREQIDEHEQELATMREVLGSALKDAAQATERTVSEILGERVAARDRREPFVTDDSLVKGAEKELAIVDALIRQFEGIAHARQKQQNTQAAALEKRIAQIEASLGALPTLNGAQDRIAEQSRKIREDALCPTCERKWEYGPAKALLDKLDADFRANDKIIAQLEEASTALPQLRFDLSCARVPLEDEPELIAARERRSRAQQNLGTYRAQMQQARSQYDARIRQDEAEFERRLLAARLEDQSTSLNAQARPVIDEKERTLAAARRDLDVLAAGLSGRQDAVRKLVTQNRINAALEEKRLADVARYQAAVDASRAELVRVTAEEAAEHDFAGLLKSFLTAFFNEVLEEIASDTNSILSRVPNVAHITVQFDEKVTARGSEIGSTLFMNGEERSLGDLSGGMETAVDLAVDLAVRRVISRRTGGRMPGWLVLDEPFTGLDNVGKEACMEILREAAAECLVLVIDHATEFKEMFSKFVTVSFQNGTARLTEAT